MNKIPYKGYLICHNAMNGTRWIEKGGHFIQHINTALHGRKIIDDFLVTGPMASAILSTGPL